MQPIKVIFRNVVNDALGKLGYRVVRWGGYPADIDPDFGRIHERCQRFTLTTAESLFSVYRACTYVESARIPGAFVEVGVWRGGSSMVAAMTLEGRDLHLFDTYEGMARPGDADINLKGEPALERWLRYQNGGHNDWCYASLDEVQHNVRSVLRSGNRVRFYKGRVEETQAQVFDSPVAVLRVNVDWYEPTAHVLQMFYPALSPGGVLILDDYGTWRGARKAVDEYFAANDVQMLLTRVDHTVRVGVKS